MTTLIARKQIIQTKSLIASELTKLQKAYYDEDMLQDHKVNNEEYLYLEMFDFLNNKELNHSVYYKIIGLNHPVIDTFTNKLSAKLTELFKVINATHFFIISHLKLDFFGNRNNNFKPLNEAYRKLEKIVDNKTYKEAFEIDLNSLPEFIEIIFWIIRCDPSVAEYILLFEKDERFQFSLCKYGNIHLTEYNVEQITDEILNELGWTMIEGKESDNFTIDGKIDGRQINI